MGSSPRAKIAWAVDFGDPENAAEGFDWDEADVDSHDFEQKVMPGLFGFTEEAPDLPEGWQQWDRDARVQWRETIRAPWEQRRDTAIPLEFVHYGYELGGTALVLKRSLASVEWGAEAVDPAALAEPSADEVAAFRRITDHLGYNDSPVSLLLMAEYG